MCAGCARLGALLSTKSGAILDLIKVGPGWAGGRGLWAVCVGCARLARSTKSGHTDVNLESSGWALGVCGVRGGKLARR